jgi:hypothetical protein
MVAGKRLCALRPIARTAGDPRSPSAIARESLSTRLRSVYRYGNEVHKVSERVNILNLLHAQMQRKRGLYRGNESQVIQRIPRVNIVRSHGKVNVSRVELENVRGNFPDFVFRGHRRSTIGLELEISHVIHHVLIRQGPRQAFDNDG